MDKHFSRTVNYFFEKKEATVTQMILTVSKKKVKRRATSTKKHRKYDTKNDYLRRLATIHPNQRNETLNKGNDAFYTDE